MQVNNATNMHSMQICSICQKNSQNIQKICKNIQKYANNMHSMQINMQTNMQTNMQNKSTNKHAQYANNKYAQNAKKIINMQINMQTNIQKCKQICALCKKYAQHAKICKTYAKKYALYAKLEYMHTMQKICKKMCRGPNQYAALSICTISKNMQKIFKMCSLCKLLVWHHWQYGKYAPGTLLMSQARRDGQTARRYRDCSVLSTRTRASGWPPPRRRRGGHAGASGPDSGG